MAKHLNRTRIRDTYLILGLCFLITIFSRPLLGREIAPHTAFDMLGGLLIGLCAVGRIYCTAFLGEHKNHMLITIGPFGMCRNPLYLCSFIGIVGIAMMSNHLTLMLIIPALFALVYCALIRREEENLLQLFGVEYTRYCEKTPRFWPSVERFNLPASLTISPKLLGNAAMDSLVWFLVLPIFEFIEFAQASGVIPFFYGLY